MTRKLKVFCAIVAAALILAFQNCAPQSPRVEFSPSTKPNPASSLADGNGQGYDGKVYLITGELCSDSSHVRSKIILRSQNTADLVRDNCQDITPKALGVNDFALNASNPDELTYLTRVFTSQVPTAGIVLNMALASPYSGFRYAMYFNFGTPADTSTTLTQSKVQLFEDGISIGPAHSVHADIANFGLGRYSHWSDSTGEQLMFSASDNTNPLTNGRIYSFKIAP